MKNTINQAGSDNPHRNKNSELEDKIALLENEKAELLAKLNWFEGHFRLEQHRKYGRSSEKTVIPEQQTNEITTTVITAPMPNRTLAWQHSFCSNYSTCNDAKVYVWSNIV